MRVGVTGHQNIREDTNWVTDSIRNEIIAIYQSIDLGFSSLAVGADQIFANVLIDLEIPLVGIIPCQRYETTFNKKNQIKYYDIIKNCATIEVLPFEDPSEQAFLEAGKKIVDSVDLLFAVWDNAPSKGIGGTGDIVEYARINKIKIIHLDIINKVIKIL